MSPPDHEPLLRRVQDCTVRILLADNTFGSGFFIAEGTIATAIHVVNRFEGADVQVLWKGRVLTPEAIRFPAQFGRDCNIDELLEAEGINPDIALLSIDLSDHPCVFAHPGVRLQDDLYIFGYSDQHPKGDPITTVFEGLSSNGRSFKLKQGQIRPGISGSPVLSLRTGAVCGMVSISRDRQSDLGGRGIPIHVMFEAFPDLSGAAARYHQRRSDWLIDLNPDQRTRLEEDAPELPITRRVRGSLSVALLASLASQCSTAQTSALPAFRSVGPPYAIVRDLVLDPHTETLWIGTADLSVFSSSPGKAWFPRDIGLPGKEINGLAFSSEQKRLYAAGERGIWFSNDYGQSWVQGDERFRHKEVICIALSPNDPDLQVVGTLKLGGASMTSATFAIFSPGSLSPSASADSGHAHFSTDGAKTWKTWPLQTINGAAIADSDTRIIYIASADGGLYWTRDRFATLSKVSGFPGDQRPVAVGISPNDPDVILVGTLEGGLWTSNDGGQSWKHVEITEKCQVSGVAFSLRDKKQVLAAGTTGVFQSDDDGRTWRKASDGLDYPWATAVRFTHSGDAYVGTSGGGVYHRRSGQRNWQPRNRGFPPIPAVISRSLGPTRWLVGGLAPV